jgi:Glycosyltransferase 61
MTADMLWQRLRGGLRRVRQSVQIARRKLTIVLVRSLNFLKLSSANPLVRYGVAISEVTVPPMLNVVPAVAATTRHVGMVDLDILAGSPLIAAKFDRKQSGDPSVSLFDVADGFCDAYGCIVSKAGALVNPISLRQEEFLRNYKNYSRTRNVQLAPGTMLAGVYSFQRGYYHWLLEVLPKILLVQQQRLSIDSLHIDQRLGFQIETVQMLVGRTWQVIPAESNTIVTARHIYAVECWDAFAHTPAWVCGVLRDAFLDRTAGNVGDKRIFVSRQDSSTRVMENEDDLFHELAKHGFWRVQLAKLSVREQANLFAQAEVVVSAHGAGMTNILFCEPETKIFEIAAPRYIFGCFADLARVCGLRYRLLPSVDLDLSRDFGWTYQFESFSVDVAETTQVIVQALRGRDSL